MFVEFNERRCMYMPISLRENQDGLFVVTIVKSNSIRVVSQSYLRTVKQNKEEKISNSLAE